METLESTQAQTPETNNERTIPEEIKREISDIAFADFYMDETDKTDRIVRSID